MRSADLGSGYELLRASERRHALIAGIAVTIPAKMATAETGCQPIRTVAKTIIAAACTVAWRRSPHTVPARHWNSRDL